MGLTVIVALDQGIDPMRVKAPSSEYYKTEEIH